MMEDSTLHHVYNTLRAGGGGGGRDGSLGASA